MTIPFGRRRLTMTLDVCLSLAPTETRQRTVRPGLPLGADDHELARLSRVQPLDVDRARWEGLALLYGGSRRI